MILALKPLAVIYRPVNRAQRGHRDWTERMCVGPEWGYGKEIETGRWGTQGRWAIDIPNRESESPTRQVCASIANTSRFASVDLEQHILV